MRKPASKKPKPAKKVKAKSAPKSKPKKKDPRTTGQRQAALIDAFGETCNIRTAARIAGIGRRTHYNWLEQDGGYFEAFRKIRVEAGEYLESVLVEHATEGWLEPVYYQGARCGSVRRFDHAGLQFLLRGMMPEKYGTQRTELTGSQGEPVQVKVNVNFVKPGDSSTD